MSTAKPALVALEIADPPARWQALGFTVEDSCVRLGGVAIRLGGSGEGITAWTVRELGGPADVAGLPSMELPPAVGAPAEHANGAVAVDHVVVITPDFDHTARALDDVGMPLRRIRDAGGFRQGFRRLGPAILELVEARDPQLTAPRFWGLVVIVRDIEGLTARLGDQLGPARAAVQPGRRIATLAAGAGLSTKVAFMDPEPA